MQSSDAEGYFEVALTLGGTEVIGFRLRSSTTRQGWVALMCFVILALAALVDALWPVIQQIS
jgi:hypothetical protein